ncbi:hypothetical protein M6B38_123545 [Iris pallida]|uniref:Uncharacterized protein n=1 Tax=Iris pallida TaxID=29817 RepID=A0AAX6H334_IRIPA|nr:hypothetical protein M6B38_123540 [Iris pallida]KAJ6835038.1 hypothetical protein M6B38_123545 [Iris pallida]
MPRHDGRQPSMQGGATSRVTY